MEEDQEEQGDDENKEIVESNDNLEEPLAGDSSTEMQRQEQ